MINSPEDLFTVLDNEEEFRNLGDAVTEELRRHQANSGDQRSPGEAAVDFVTNPEYVDLVAPVLVALGWRPPDWLDVDSPALTLP